ncbi:hypothetical protein D3C71_182480 [compost metagenome]
MNRVGVGAVVSSEVEDKREHALVLSTMRGGFGYARGVPIGNGPGIWSVVRIEGRA